MDQSWQGEGTVYVWEMPTASKHGVYLKNPGANLYNM